MKNNNNDLSHHSLPNSATMVGVCIMVISIVKGMPPNTVNYLIDKALAISGSYLYLRFSINDDDCFNIRF